MDELNFTVGEWLRAVEAYANYQKIPVRDNENGAVLKDLSLRAFAADTCDGITELRGLATGEGEVGVPLEWVKEKHGLLAQREIAAGRSAACVDDLTLPEFARRVAVRAEMSTDRAMDGDQSPTGDKSTSTTHWGVLNTLLKYWQGDIDDKKERGKIFADYSANHAGKQREGGLSKANPELPNQKKLGELIRNFKKSIKKKPSDGQ